MSNVIICNYHSQGSGFSCLALIFNLGKSRTTILHAKNRFQVASCYVSSNIFICRSSDLYTTYGPVIKASCSKSGGLDSILAGF